MARLLTEALLESKEGFVEDRDKEGNPVYVPTEKQQLSDDNDEIVFDLVYRITLLEWGVNG